MNKLDPTKIYSNRLKLFLDDDEYNELWHKRNKERHDIDILINSFRDIIHKYDCQISKLHYVLRNLLLSLLKETIHTEEYKQFIHMLND